MLHYSKVTGLPVVRPKNPLQSRRSQGYLIANGRRTFGVYAKRARLRHLDDVTAVLSKCRRNNRPKQANILVTNLPETVTAREVVGVYLRRWWVELLF